MGAGSCNICVAIQEKSWKRHGGGRPRGQLIKEYTFIKMWMCILLAMNCIEQTGF